MSRPRPNFQRRFIIAATASSCSPAKRRGDGGSCFGRECCERMRKSEGTKIVVPAKAGTHTAESIFSGSTAVAATKARGYGSRVASLARDDIVFWRELPPDILPPRCKILQRLLVRCRIEAEDAPALADLFRDKILKCRHLESLVRDFVAGKHRRIAAADRHIDLDRLMQRQIGRRARPVVVGAIAKLCDFARVVKAAVGDDTGTAPLHQPRHKDRAGGRRTRILAAVHDKHCAGRALLHCLALGMGAVAKDIELVEVLARRHVAQREGLTDHGRLIGAQGMGVLNALDAKTALEQRGRDGGGRDGFQFVAGGVAESGHGSILAVVPEREARTPETTVSKSPARRPAHRTRSRENRNRSLHWPGGYDARTSSHNRARSGARAASMQRGAWPIPPPAHRD